MAWNGGSIRPALQCQDSAWYFATSYEKSALEDVALDACVDQGFLDAATKSPRDLREKINLEKASRFIHSPRPRCE